MVSFLSSWVFLSPFFLWTTNFNILHHLAHYVFVEFGGGKKDFILRTLLSSSEFPPLEILFSSFHLSPPLYGCQLTSPKAFFQNLFSVGLAFSFACSVNLAPIFPISPFIIHNTIDFLILYISSLRVLFDSS